MTSDELIGHVAAAYLRDRLTEDDSTGVARYLLDCLTADQTAAIAQTILADAILSNLVEIKLPVHFVGDPKRLDRDRWLARFSALLLNGIRFPANSPIDLAAWRRTVREGGCRIHLRGYSHIFVSGPSDSAECSDFAAVAEAEHSYQEGVQTAPQRPDAERGAPEIPGQRQSHRRASAAAAVGVPHHPQAERHFRSGRTGDYVRSEVWNLEEATRRRSRHCLLEMAF